MFVLALVARGPARAGRAVFAPGNAVRFIRALPAGGKFFVRIFGFDGAGHDMTFTLDGLDEVRGRVGVACKWPPVVKP